MLKNRFVLIGLVGALIFGALILSLFGAKEAERKRRIDQELKLVEMTSQLEKAKSELSTLMDERKTSEGELNSKIESLNQQIEDYERTIKSQETQIASLIADNEALLKEKEDAQKRSEEMAASLREMEQDKIALTRKVKRLESEPSQPAMLSMPPDSGMASERPALNVPSMPAYTPSVPQASAPQAMNPVRLGDLVIQRSSGAAATVQNVNKTYGFFIVNAGGKDGLQKGMPIHVLRNDRLVARAVIEKTKDDMSAAVLSADSKEDIRVGDVITIAPAGGPSASF